MTSTFTPNESQTRSRVKFNCPVECTSSMNFKPLEKINKELSFFSQFTKALTYIEWPKMKRDTQQRSSPFTKKKTT